MKEYLNNINKKEDGVVLVTSMLFLMIVTLLAVSSLQSSKTDVLISGNQNFVNHSQQAANIGIMDAKNWLASHRGAGTIPNNFMEHGEIVIKARDLSGEDVGNGGLMDDNTSEFAGEKPTINRPIVIDDIGTYDRKIVKISDQDNANNTVTEADFEAYMNLIRLSSLAPSKTADPSMIEYYKKYSMANGEGLVENDVDGGRAGYQHYYVLSIGKDIKDSSVAANSEAIISFQFIEASKD